MIGAQVRERGRDDLVLGLRANHLAALACDLSGHLRGQLLAPCLSRMLHQRLEAAAHTYVQLCGQLVVELRGRRVEQRLPSRQGRTLFAYLVLQRPRAVGRDELVDAIWGATPPKNHGQALTVLLSKARAAVGADVLVGRGSVHIALPPDARVDIEQAVAAVHRAESAVVQHEWARAWSAALCAQYVAERPLLPDQDGLPWLDGWRRRLDDTLERALEAYGAACLGLGGTELAGAERAARRLLEHNPLRETGYGLLMRTLAARGRVPEALGVYEQARTVLREELGIPPSRAVAELHAQLLEGHDPATTSPRRTNSP
jgi:SARP family transcriptional regulator, regulator of embCAB operon